MYFKMNNAFVRWHDKENYPAILEILLPDGPVKVLANSRQKPPIQENKCWWTGEQGPTFLLAVALNLWEHVYTGGDTLITLEHLGYDLLDKKMWKNLSKEKALVERDKLWVKHPELFDESRVDIDYFESDNDSSNSR